MSSVSSASPHDAPRRLWLVPLGVYLVHLVLVLDAFRPSVVFSGQPYGGADYQTHYQQVSTLSETLARFGRHWVYDPFLLAGQPEGLIFDVDNKAHFLFCYLLESLGVSRPVAFNLFPLLVALCAPLLLLAAARLLGVGRRAALVTLILGTLLWSFDSLTRFCWSGGMISFVATAHLSLLVLALFYRLVDELAGPLARRTLLHALLCAVLLALALLIHVWAFAILVLPLCAIYVRDLRRLGASGHLVVWAVALTALAANLYWLYPALTHAEMIAPSGKVGQAHPGYLLADFFEIFVNPVNTGFILPQTLVRFVALGFALLALLSWRRERDRRTFVGATTLLWLLGLSYVAALVPGLKETEPYRFAIALGTAAVVFAGPWAASALTRTELSALRPNARVVLVLLVLLLLPRLARPLLYFVPELLPLGAQGSSQQRHDQPIAAHGGYRLTTTPAPYTEVAAFFNQATLEPGRVLVQHWPLGEHLRWATRREIIGGFPDRRLVHEAANIFRYRIEPRLHGDELAQYLVRYNIRYLVIYEPLYPMVERRRDLLEPLRLVGGQRVYRVRHGAGPIALGSGRVHAQLNRIAVTEARPAPGTQRLVLRYHYFPTLRCAPSCRLVREAIAHDPVGFIAVEGTPTLPAAFTVDNGY